MNKTAGATKIHANVASGMAENLRFDPIFGVADIEQLPWAFFLLMES
jgi:hypothetical protein